MRVSIKKTVVGAIAALGMATAMASMPTPAEAQWHGGGFHGGGFHGGGLSRRRLGRRLARRGLERWRLGLAARGLGRRLELRLGLGRRLGLGLGSGLGDRGGDRARRGRDCLAAWI